MSDLISRSALLKEFETHNSVYHPNELWHITGIKAFIENQPTAYDVDKVLAELEESRKDIEKSTMLIDFFKMGYKRAINEAIEIVKGGVE